MHSGNHVHLQFVWQTVATGAGRSACLTHLHWGFDHRHPTIPLHLCSPFLSEVLANNSVQKARLYQYSTGLWNATILQLQSLEPYYNKLEKSLANPIPTALTPFKFLGPKDSQHRKNVNTFHIFPHLCLRLKIPLRLLENTSGSSWDNCFANLGAQNCLSHGSPASRLQGLLYYSGWLQLPHLSDERCPINQLSSIWLQGKSYGTIDAI